MGYHGVKCPYFFEGEAELRHLRDNIYLGGYGQRSEEKALDWIAETFKANVIKIPETERSYHVDCQVFPVDDQTVILKEDLPSSVISEIEEVAEVVQVPEFMCEQGICNSVRIGYNVFNASNINEPNLEPDYIQDEKDKNEELHKICRSLGLELIFINLSEMLKSGALLSCCVAYLEKETMICNPW